MCENVPAIFLVLLKKAIKFIPLSLSLSKIFTLVEEGSFKVKEQFPYTMIQTVIVSGLTDGLIIIRLPVDGESSKV